MLCTRHSFGRLICTGLYFFFTGVEYAVILPTLNGYLISLDAPTGFLGIVLAAFSLTGSLSSPVFGRITDRTGSTKLCIVISNIFEIGGNFWYFASKDFTSVLVARLVAGIGSGAGSSLLGMLSRATTQKERATAFSSIVAVRQTGLLIGPAFNVFFNDLNIDIGPFLINQYTGPGLLMASIWTLHTLLTLVIFKDTKKGEVVEDNVIPNVDVDESCNKNAANVINNEVKLKSKQTGKIKSLINEFMREEIIVLLATTFMINFTETGIETATTPMTLLFFQWGTLYNSYFFCAIGASVILIVIGTGYLSKYISDRALILFGCFTLIVGYFLVFLYSLMFRSQNELESPTWLFPLWVVSVIILVLGLAVSAVSHATLFSKLTSMETQAFSQGVRLAAMGVGQLLGPLWAASTSTKYMLPAMSAVYVVLLCILAVMLCMSYKLLAPHIVLPRANSDSSSISICENENSPLLSNVTA